MTDSDKSTANRLLLPDDVLVIHYADLSSDPAVRLEVIAAIGQLLGDAVRSQLLSALAPAPAAARALLAWLSGDGATRFWRVDRTGPGTPVVVAHRPCRKHVLVGTRHLLHDLGQVRKRTAHFPQLADLDLVWEAAIRLEEQLRAE